ncbi:hypothetical protein PILCRDRAFT_428 [Piloderma croceum F 1598]|uniref:Uncharacterized protein n=1 Tax=Piloderma croceum (strain F 1598) TaxID=765440 RepID=A0A0C3G820_PILCF|nr:hypothetical protein PILCRDRAFT_428 [Piloderma croceum F 1598]
MSLTVLSPYGTYCGAWAPCSWSVRNLSYLETWMKCGVMPTKVLWKAAADWDRPNRPRRLATEFGLVDPADPRRPTFTEDIFRLLHAELAKQERAAMPSVVPTPQLLGDSILITLSTESTAQSGHVYLAARKEVQPRTKVKTRSAPSMDARTEEDEIIASFLVTRLSNI